MSDPNDLELSGKTDELLPAVYEELRRIAASQMVSENAGHTLQATGLVHEAYMRLIGDGSGKWQNRGHFFAAAARAMRRILIDHARRKQSIRHGGDRDRIELRDDDAVQAPLGQDLLELDDALKLLSRTRPSWLNCEFLLGFQRQRQRKYLRSRNAPPDEPGNMLEPGCVEQLRQTAMKTTARNARL